ncbi:MAG: hypothetical protein JKY54_17150, partial [Flavobacteriales bacterium]|nr:hypothetical protein [Flavobacteriales bacterium]
MGMSYCFHPKTEKVDLDDFFPSSLGWFSERVGAYNEDSEFKQLEKIFGIDMKILNHMEYEWDEVHCSIKTDVQQIEELAFQLKKAIVRIPDFYQQITYQ